MDKRLKKRIGISLKAGLSVLFLFMVYRQISFDEVFQIIKQCNWLYIALAVVFFVASQMLSAKRLMLYFAKSDTPISARENYILYAIGMFYNFFIPGGIGGDAYKVYYLHKNKEAPIINTSSALFLDRVIGLVILLAIILGLVSLLTTISVWLKAVVILLIPIGIAYTFSVVDKLGEKYSSIISNAMLYSLLIQALQIASIVCVLFSLKEYQFTLIYVLVFLASSVMAVLSLGGIGTREFAFFHMAEYISIHPGTSVSVGFMFVLITALVSFVGLYFHLVQKETPALSLRNSSA